MDAHGVFPRHDGHGAGADADAHGSPQHAAAMMMAVFQTSTATSLFSARWTPRSAGAYAATCVFLAALAAAFRGLLALRARLESRWLDRELGRRYVVVAGKAPPPEAKAPLPARDPLARHAALALAENGVEENVVVVRTPTARPTPWRLSVDPLRAAVDTVVAGVGYLL